MYKKDDSSVYNNENLIRRRFYLTQESLDYLDQLAKNNNQSPSILLDNILKQLANKKN